MITRKLNSGLRGSNPSSWLGKPEHYHYAKPAKSIDRVDKKFTTRHAGLQDARLRLAALGSLSGFRLQRRRVRRLAARSAAPKSEARKARASASAAPKPAPLGADER